MSLGSIGASSGHSHGLGALLAHLTGTPPAAVGAPGHDGDFDDGVNASAAPVAPSAANSGNAVTGGGRAAISNQILALLTQLQQQAADPGATTTSTSPTTTSIAPAATATDPLTQLFSALDTNGDGSVSQSEMESYIQQQGGTAAQADALFAGLNHDSTGNLTQAQLANDLQQAQASDTGHHHHRHEIPSADELGNKLVSAMDSDANGSVDQSEFTSFVTGLGGTPSEAAADFAALDPGNTGSVNAAQFSAATRAFETASNTRAIATNATSPILTLLDAFAQNATAAGSTASMTA